MWKSYWHCKLTTRDELINQMWVSTKSLQCTTNSCRARKLKPKKIATPSPWRTRTTTILTIHAQSMSCRQTISSWTLKSENMFWICGTICTRFSSCHEEETGVHGKGSWLVQSNWIDGRFCPSCTSWWTLPRWASAQFVRFDLAPTSCRGNCKILCQERHKGWWLQPPCHPVWKLMLSGFLISNQFSP